MSILSKHLALVNEQAEFHEKMAEKLGGKGYRANLHKTTTDRFKALAADLLRIDKELDELDAPRPKLKVDTKAPFQLSLSIEDVADLPDELRNELNISEGDRTEFAILNVLEEAGGIISLDRLLINIYRKTGEIHKRTALTNRLYRMGLKNLVFSVPGKKGVYSSEQLSAAQAAALFGAPVKPEN